MPDFNYFEMIQYFPLDSLKKEIWLIWIHFVDMIVFNVGWTKSPIETLDFHWHTNLPAQLPRKGNNSQKGMVKIIKWFVSVNFE